MRILQEQIKNFNEMKNSETKQKEFNDRMVNLTWKYQKIYNFQIGDKKGNEFWNNEADAFKHTFGSALMEFEMGSLGSLAGGIEHERKTPNNPLNEWNMDSWNNREGRKIAQEIKNEYGEKNFRNLPKELQEDIIARKTMVKMKNGDLITDLNDKRKFKGIIEKVSKPKENKNKGILTGGASSVYNTISNNSDDPLQLYTKNDNEKTSSQKLADGIDNDEWDDNDIAFLEAFLSDEKDKHLIKQAKEKRKQRVKDKGNKGKGPNGEDGYWYTTKQGKHVFVPDDKTA